MGEDERWMDDLAGDLARDLGGAGFVADSGIGGDLPAAVRAGLRRRRVARRMRAIGSAAAVLALCGAVTMVLLRQPPGAPELGEKHARGPLSSEVIGIDDPIFRGLDRKDNGDGADAQDAFSRAGVWRAGLSRSAGLSLEI